MRYFLLLLTLLIALPAGASDYAREQKWADEILPAVLSGDPVWLEMASGHKYLSLYTAVPQAKGAVVLVHGIGVHPDWGLVGMLRQRLADAGYATLSVQMPVLAADAKPEAYLSTFPEASARLYNAVAFLKGKGYAKVALVSHSLGCRMSYRYLSSHDDPAVKGWVALSAPGTDDWGRLRIPVLDLYGENDLPQVLGNAKTRAAGLVQTGSAQTRLAGADHFYEGKDDALLEQVKGFLEKTL